MATELSPDLDRRTGWWIVAAVVLAIVGLFFFSFVGTFIFGLFVYYGARPINRRIQRGVDSRALAATVTLLFIVLPTLALLGYTGFVAFRETTAFLGPEAVDTALQRIPGAQQSLGGSLQNLPRLAEQLGQVSGLQQGFSPWSVRSARSRTRCSTSRSR